MTAVAVMAKAPVPGRVKTRLCPPCTPGEAAGLAEAALTDTLAALAGVAAERRILALDGTAGPWLPPGIEVVAQQGRTLDERIAAVLDGLDEPVLLIGMDTPQAGPAVLDAALARLAEGGVDAVLGRAADGGWWALGLLEPHPLDVLGVPMSTPATGAAQHDRLVARGRRVAALPVLRDVDTMADARAVAAAAPGTHFAARLRALGHVVA